MVKKEMGSNSGMCGMCSSNPCKCGSGWYKAVLGLVVVVLGLLMLWPKGWFTFEHSFGVLVVLFGLKMICWNFKCH